MTKAQEAKRARRAKRDKRKRNEQIRRLHARQTEELARELEARRQYIAQLMEEARKHVRPAALPPDSPIR